MIMIAAGLSGCSDDKEVAQKEAKMKQLLSQKTEKNIRIERWKVVGISQSSSATDMVKIVKIVYPNTDLEKTLQVEGHDDLEVGMDVIIEIKVTDLSMNKNAETLKNREFVKIIFY
jgi:hypothetical protein